jgi:hypothetical protein
MTESSLHTSLALVNFARALAWRAPDWFRPDATVLSHAGSVTRAEEAIMFRLADQAVRVWGAAMLELSDRKNDADTLRKLPPIQDRQSSALAAATLRALDSKILCHANSCAMTAAGDAGTSEFIGTQAAFAAIALANRYDDARRQDVYESATALLAELCAKASPLH